MIDPEVKDSKLYLLETITKDRFFTFSTDLFLRVFSYKNLCKKVEHNIEKLKAYSYKKKELDLIIHRSSFKQIFKIE